MTDVMASLALRRDWSDRPSGWVETVSVWSGESRRSWLGVLDGSLSFDPAPHLGLTLGAPGGLGGRTGDVGVFGRVSVHR